MWLGFVAVSDLRFNPPPGWETPEGDWKPPPGWTPDPAWPPAPTGWQFWLRGERNPDTPPAPRPPEHLATSQAPVSSGLSASATSSEPSQAPGNEAGSGDPVVVIPDPDERQEAGALRVRVAELEAEVATLRASDASVDLNDERVLQDVGIYRYHHPLENAAAYKDRLMSLDEEITAMVRANVAVLASDLFTYNNSLAQGRKMTKAFSRLMLRAYNAEADNCVRTLRAGNVVTSRRRLEKCMEAVAKLGAMMEMRVNPSYHHLRLREIELSADYLMKVQEEKEAAREERARLREERKAEQELAAERARLDKEREHYANALAAVATSADPQAAAELNRRLAELDEAIEANDYRIANIRAGYVYVISNRGALGPGVVKIGMTRRLEPMDRVRELGDASVPFPFDVHAMFFADDAVGVEGELHRRFADRRLNHVNLRREFFFATPAEVRHALAELQGNLLHFVDDAESTQFLQSRRYWPAETSAGPV